MEEKTYKFENKGDLIKYAMHDLIIDHPVDKNFNFELITNFDNSSKLADYVLNRTYCNYDISFNLKVREKDYQEERNLDSLAQELEKKLIDIAVKENEYNHTLEIVKERIEKINDLISPQKLIIEGHQEDIFDISLFIQSSDNVDKLKILAFDLTVKPGIKHKIYNPITSKSESFSINALDEYFLSDDFLKHLTRIRNFEKKRLQRLAIYKKSFTEKSKLVLYSIPGYIVGAAMGAVSMYFTVFIFAVISIFLGISNFIAKSLNKKHSLSKHD